MDGFFDDIDSSDSDSDDDNASSDNDGPGNDTDDDDESDVVEFDNEGSEINDNTTLKSNEIIKN